MTPDDISKLKSVFTEFGKNYPESDKKKAPQMAAGMMMKPYAGKSISTDDYNELVVFLRGIVGTKLPTGNLKSRLAKMKTNESVFDVESTHETFLESFVGRVVEGKDDYQIYHKSYSSAVSAIHDYAKQRGYTLNDDETFDTIGLGPKKPKEGDTNRTTLTLYKDGKEQRKALHSQVYGRGAEGYELNMYIS